MSLGNILSSRFLTKFVDESSEFMYMYIYVRDTLLDKLYDYAL